MSTENKVVDISVEANIPFSMVMQFEDVDDTLQTETITPIDLTGCTFKGVIKNSLEEDGQLLETLSITISDATHGIVSVSLSKAQTATLTVAASKQRDKYNPRLRFAGYYDIIMTKVSTDTNFRVLEGKVFISDGVTS